MGLIPLGVGTTPTYGVGAASVEHSAGGGESPESQTASIARGLGLLGVGGSIVGLLGVLLPHPPSFDAPVLLATQGLTFILAVLLYVRAGDLPAWLIRAMPALASVLTSVAVIATADPTSGYALFYVWIAIIAFYFLSRIETVLLIAWAIVNYGAVVLILGAPPVNQTHAELHFFAMVAGTLLAASVPLLYLRGRFNNLVARLSDAARTDLLTGLANDQGLNQTLTRELERARLSQCDVSVLVADLDRFKELSEKLGWRTADELLRRIGALFADATRPIDTVARTGATEFSIVLPEAAEDEAYLVAEQLLNRVRRGFRDEPTPLTTSIGLVSYPRDAVTGEELINLANKALVAAKVLGADRAVVYSREVEDVLSGTVRRRPVEPHAHLSTMLSLAEALDLRDGGTARHSQAVGEYSEMMARELGLAPQRVERVRLAGILHDIGKVGIPDSILRKEGLLDEAEWAQMRRHPELGARILGTRELVDIREWVLASHERPDGKGYPRGLRGEEIPLEARIVAVAEAYEAMTGDRTYRPGLGEAAAHGELLRCAGSQFDAEVVDVFLRALDRREQAVR
jgi:diguanylate cyclase (GGDEF)-like protein/putative nucleotidyltransferase with HDIG domain